MAGPLQVEADPGARNALGQGEEMREHARIAVVVSTAAVLVGMLYLISRQSTAHPSDERSTPSRIDVFELMVPAKNLPSEWFEIHWVGVRERIRGLAQVSVPSESETAPDTTG